MRASLSARAAPFPDATPFYPQLMKSAPNISERSYPIRFYATSAKRALLSKETRDAPFVASSPLNLAFNEIDADKPPIVVK